MENIALSVHHISKHYPGVVALDDISLDFRQGEVHALLGENGAGKSTLIKTIAGAIEPTEGTICIGDKEYKALTPAQARAHGIEVIYQEFNLVPSMSVAENIYLGGRAGDGPLVDFKAMRKGCRELFAQFNIRINPDVLVGELSPAYQQIVEITKAISKDVKILIMDEPTAPLTVAEVEVMFHIIDELKSRGVTILYISHRLEEIFRVADRVTIMRDGKFICTLNAGETNRQELIEHMVGRQLNDSYPVRQTTIGPTVLKVRNLSGNGVRDVSFELHQGEILGLAGLVGCGRTEIMRVLYGAEPREGGEVEINGRPVTLRSPSDAMANGFGLIPEDRKQQGVFLEFPIYWNIALTVLKKISQLTVVDRKKEKNLAEDYREKLQIRTPSVYQLAKNLSGGNQQKVAIAKTLATNANILIFDEPTRGIDVGAKQEIYKLMNDLVAQGKSIIMISSEMDELLGMSDRIIVLSEGHMAGCLSRETFSKTEILDLASGSR